MILSDFVEFSGDLTFDGFNVLFRCDNILNFHENIFNFNVCLFVHFLKNVYFKIDMK